MAMLRKYRDGWTRFFSLTYWRIQITRLRAGQPPINIIATFEVEL